CRTQFLARVGHVTTSAFFPYTTLFRSGQRGFRVILGLLVLVVMMGVAVAEGSGVISTAVRSVVTTVSGRWLTFAIALTGITGSVASDAVIIVLPPLAAMAFLAVGRSPLLGIGRGGGPGSRDASQWGRPTGQRALRRRPRARLPRGRRRPPQRPSERTATRRAWSRCGSLGRRSGACATRRWPSWAPWF